MTVSADPRWDDVADARRWWSRYIESNQYGSAATVHSSPGVVEEPDADHRGSAQFIAGGWMVIVLGDSKIAGPQLQTIASTL